MKPRLLWGVLAIALGAVVWAASVPELGSVRATSDSLGYLPLVAGNPPQQNRILYTIGEAGESGYTTALFSVNPDGTDRRQLTKAVADIALGSWSPNRETIAFSRGTPLAPYQVGLMNPDGSNIRPLSTPGVELAGTIDWSPDGETVAFEALASTGEWEIMTINVDGSDLDNLTDDLPGHARSPVWSPDGRILFVHDSGQQTDLILMNAGGDGRIPLTDNEFTEYAPDYSPDGRTILFTSTTAVNVFALYTMPATGGAADLLLTNGRDGRWSPDGRQIVFVATAAAASGIYRANSAGQAAVPVDTSPGAVLPDW